MISRSHSAQSVSLRKSLRSLDHYTPATKTRWNVSTAAVKCGEQLEASAKEMSLLSLSTQDKHDPCFYLLEFRILYCCGIRGCWTPSLLNGFFRFKISELPRLFRRSCGIPFPLRSNWFTESGYDVNTDKCRNGIRQKLLKAAKETDACKQQQAAGKQTTELKYKSVKSYFLLVFLPLISGRGDLVP